jgi:hypothetical protein
VTVAELIEQLKAMPPMAEVYVYEFGNEDYSERDPMLDYDEGCKTLETSGGKLAYPHGRVKL